MARQECEEHVAITFRPLTVTHPAVESMVGPQAGRHTERSFAYKTEAHIHVPRYGQIDWDQLDRDGYIIVGSPDTVTRKIKEQQEALGFGLFVPYVPFGSMEPPPQALRSVELFGKEVLPNLR